MKNVSFNVSFGVFGFYLRNEKQTVNGEPLGNRFTSGANFKFNIFNINFGIGVHIGKKGMQYRVSPPSSLSWRLRRA